MGVMSILLFLANMKYMSEFLHTLHGIDHHLLFQTVKFISGFITKMHY